MSTAPLSKTGARMLAAAEAKIERGLGTFVEVGDALSTIRDGRLYREDYDTFEAYCQGRWGFTSRRARQLMEAAEIGTTVPVSNEAQARELTGLDPDEAIEVYGEAKAEGDVTAAGIKAVRKRRSTSETTTVTYDETPPPGVDPVTGEIAEGGDGAGTAGEVGTPEPASPPTPSSAPPVDPALRLMADLSTRRAEVAKWLAFDRHEQVIDSMTAEQRADYRSFVHSVWTHANATLDLLDAPARLKAVQ